MIWDWIRARRDRAIRTRRGARWQRIVWYTKGRVSQEPVEVTIAPTSAKARVSQVPVESVLAPTTAKARVSQQPIEVVLQSVPGPARITQLPVEVLLARANERISVYIID